MGNDAAMPGAWKCHQCGFILQKNILAPNGIFANMEPHEDVCPNDCWPMEPLTWREVNHDLHEMLMLERKRLDWLDKHCSFVADAEFNFGPFKVGQLRDLADAGLKATGTHESLSE